MALSDPLSPEEIADDLTELEKRILYEMSDGEHVYPMRETARDARVPYGTARKIFRTLHKMGLAHFGHLTSEDSNHVVGSGYWRSHLGTVVLKHIS